MRIVKLIVLQKQVLLLYNDGYWLISKRVSENPIGERIRNSTSQKPRAKVLTIRRVTRREDPNNITTHALKNTCESFAILGAGSLFDTRLCLWMLVFL